MLRPIEYITLENIGVLESKTLECKDFDVVEITGGGEQGKTTFLNALIANLTGKDVADLLNHEKLEAWIDTRVAGVRVRRKINAKGTVKLEVWDEQGIRVTEGLQDYLNQRFGCRLLRPLDLYRMKDDDRTATIMHAIDIDMAYANERLKAIIGNDGWRASEQAEVLSYVQRAYKAFYDDRAAANRVVKDIQAEYDALVRDGVREEVSDTPPTPPLPLSEVFEQRQAIITANQARLRFVDEILNMANMLEDSYGVPCTFTYSAEHVEVDTSTLDAQIADYNAAMEGYQQASMAWQRAQAWKQQYASVSGRLEVAKAAADKLNSQVKALDDLPNQLLQRAKMPMANMTIRGKEIYIDDTPIGGRGDSMKLRACVQIAMALAKVPFVLIDGAESMDPDQRAELLDYVKEQGFQALMTIVTRGPLTIEGITFPDEAAADDFINDGGGNDATTATDDPWE